MATEQNIRKTAQSAVAPAISKVLLPNGSECYTLPTASAGLTRVIIRFDHPADFSLHKTEAELAFQLMKSGTTRLSTAEFVSQMEETGAMLISSAGNDSGAVEFTVLDDELSTILPLVMEMIHSPSMPEDEFARIHQIGKENWRISRKQPQVLAREQMMHTLFADHPYGTLVTGESLEALTHADVVQFQRNMVQKIRPVFFLSSIDVEGAVKALAAVVQDYPFGVVPTQNGAAPINAQSDQSKGTSQHITVPGTVQSAIRMGRRVFTRSHPDYIIGKVASTILGGYFSSRLMANLREDKGYTYGVGAGLITLVSDGYLTISAEVGSNHLTHALSEIHKELDKLCHELVDEDELQTVKQYLRGAALRESDGAFSRLALLASLQRQNISFDWPAHYIAGLEMVSGEDVLRFANEWLSPAKLTTVTAGVEINGNQQ